MYILGITTMGESAAALLKDGILVAAVEEERLSRIKHDGSFPLKSIKYCLDEENIKMADIDHIAIYWQPWRVKTRAYGILSKLFTRPKQFISKLSFAIREFMPSTSNTESYDGSWSDLFRVKLILRNEFGSFKGKVHYLDHHKCHIASTFYASPFDEAAIVVFDGAGEEDSTTLAVGKGISIK
ncbi:MAG TPA: hypothetical protein ENI73_09630, partial [Spirochaetes bacterium]|nr:hypothetical protein [Spirochaetota bacterium]